ncbi:MAG: bifunctional methylenetetrahydrofolate dehydrogenase/methenyltetrahydrofolate cyclohydrolase FolD [Candidatus Latescibacteria bacterium]|nr:bifunctional methylenetetrahydrofolate dehydrogenase/methenyltetrahydrofolate cyclohydrolase FolD [Candidatus Latescibacterota bacterium]NIM21521.1 bifunctional methylenetetrahydrofolate dehydrogenase/methenyltetrahydrofolate cyclohydrolase FolD [Candidatus Latescibacterota bacterium]NIM65692.1 bifunctional methylenetetrahydrofolate dehydrogenase/methenyltetrahydrofolate cyclohydrolase FolD [Candidatus Latescibacterota bacterium]NIO02074.1 bifunctional methylenetetrahydrofolate dehydrogenase/
MELLDGKALAATIKQEVKDSVPEGARPALAVVQVGEDPASSVYIRSKVRSCEECGFDSQHVHLEEGIRQAELLKTLRKLNDDQSVHGLLLQLPLPQHLDPDEAIRTIEPIKDVDGFHPENLGLLVSGQPRFVPCTPLGIRELLVRNRIDIAGKRVVVLGRSIVVGKPLALLFALKGEGGDATVSICHSRTKNLGEHAASADILVAAMGKPGLVTGDMVKEGAVVVDVGINRVPDPSKKKGYRLVGDVDFESVAPKVSHITPVPGGVGPMTVAMLMASTLKAYSLQVASPNAVR